MPTDGRVGPPPRHIAFIPDGNRRWGNREGVLPAAAYERGERTIFATVEVCRQLGVEWATFFLFSAENWKRDTDDVNYLVAGRNSLLYRTMRRRAEQIHERNVRFRLMGDSTWGLAENALEVLRETEDLTRDNTGLTLVFALNYGGRQELLRAARLAAERSNGTGMLSIEEFSQCLYLPDMPDVDLLIRTSGEQRISNYLLWHMAFAELAFIDDLWPDFNAKHLDDCIAKFNATQRRFGT